MEFQKGKHGSNAEQTAGGQGNVTETEKATAESQDSKAHGTRSVSLTCMSSNV